MADDNEPGKDGQPRERLRDPSWGKCSYFGPLDNCRRYEEQRQFAGGGLPKLSVMMQLKYPKHPATSYETFGGYFDPARRWKCILCRRYNDTDPKGRTFPGDGVTLLLPKGFSMCPLLFPDTHLSVTDWWRFQELAPGDKFRIGKNVWVKMSEAQLRRTLYDRNSWANQPSSGASTSA